MSSKRNCCVALCDNEEQLVNTRCTACKDKCYAEKHYICMTCYINLLKASYIAKIPVTCPLDRSDMPVEPSLLAMVETEMIMNDFFKHMHMTVNHLSNVRSRAQVEVQQDVPLRSMGAPLPIRSPIRTMPTGPSMGEENRIRRSVRVRRSSPVGVDNVRDSMEYIQVFQQHVNPFPQFSRDEDDAAADGFHDPNNVVVNLFPEHNNENTPPAPADPSHPSWNT
jgi:hypothetical protein